MDVRIIMTPRTLLALLLVLAPGLALPGGLSLHYCLQSRRICSDCREMAKAPVRSCCAAAENRGSERNRERGPVIGKVCCIGVGAVSPDPVPDPRPVVLVDVLAPIPQAVAVAPEPHREPAPCREPAATLSAVLQPPRPLRL